MKTKPKTQTDKILAYLEKGRAITPLDALNRFGCFRLSARIDELRNMGHHIITETVKKNGKRFAKYPLL